MAGETVNEKALTILVDTILSAVEKRLEVYTKTLDKKIAKVRVGSENIVPASISNLQVKEQGIGVNKLDGLHGAIVDVLREYSLIA